MFAKHCLEPPVAIKPSPWWRPIKRVKTNPVPFQRSRVFFLLSVDKSPAFTAIRVESRISTKDRAEERAWITSLQRDATYV